MQWGKGKVVTLVDDSISFGQQVKWILKQSGYVGDYQFFSGANLFIKGGGLHSDIVVSDLNMPIHDGFYVLQYLRDNGYEGCFILCSADVMLLEESRSDLPADIDILIKPINFKTFASRVRSCLT